MGESAITELTEEQSWEILRRENIGRLAFHLGDEVHIAPVNFGVDASNRIVFRTAEGSKLLGMAMDRDVAFEIDNVGETTAFSVVVRGQAKELFGIEAEAANEIGLRSWVPTDKYHVMGIDVDEITGRRFLLDRTAGAPRL